MPNIGLINIQPKEIRMDGARHNSYNEITFDAPMMLLNTLVLDINATWLRAEIDGDYIAYWVDENTSGEQRRGTITMRGRDIYGHILTDSTVIIQDSIQGSAYLGTVYEEYIKDSSSASSVIFPSFEPVGVSRFEFVYNSDWVTLSMATNNRQMKAVFTANNTPNTRSVDVELKIYDESNNYARSYFFKVKQNGATEFVAVSTNNIYTDYKSESGYISVFPQWKNLDNEVVIEAIYPQYQSGFNWITLNGVQTETSEPFDFGYTIQENTTDDERVADIVIEWRCSGNIYQERVRVTQTARPEHISFPIWKDTDIEVVSDATYVEYRMVNNGKIIYDGKIYDIDGKKSVRINEIARDFFNEHLDFDNEFYNNDGYIEIDMYISDDGWQTYLLHKVLFPYNDWCYEDSDCVLYNPVKNEVDYRQYFVTTYINKDDDSMLPTLTLGVPTMPNIKTYIPSKNKMMNITKKVSDIAESGVLVYGDGNDAHYMNITCNHKYCLYYRDVNGGYQWVLLNRASKKTDNISILSYKREVRNYTLERSDVQYQKNIKEKYTLKTDMLNDRESERMAMAVRSVDCYLHDLENNKIYPVNITSTSVEHKTYYNNSKKPYNYTIEVEVAQDRFSR